jgi:hypothetical protein
MACQVFVEHRLFREATALVFIRLRRPNHGLGLAVDASWLEQHPLQSFNSKTMPGLLESRSPVLSN